jgi:3',5'-cyclic AMP phosphodiesterase CpdA
MNRRDFLSAAPLAARPTAPDPPAAVESGDLTLVPKTPDRWELTFKPSRPLRILQITDTHFSSKPDWDALSARSLAVLVRATDPDLIVHTGDFVNNDSDDPVVWDGVDFLNGLNRPWALCFGNHDYPFGATGCRTLEDYRTGLRNCAMGYSDRPAGRMYCYRHDLKGKGDEPAATLCYFQVGYAKGDRKISDPQLAWFAAQLAADTARGWDHPILVFVHIPLIEYELLVRNRRAAGGFMNEGVSFDSDTGASFTAFAGSKRVRGVFCGHDHLNSYFGTWQGVGLHYGRVSGWGGYGQWPRGGRLISLNPATGRFTHREVLV